MAPPSSREVERIFVPLCILSTLITEVSVKNIHALIIFFFLSSCTLTSTSGGKSEFEGPLRIVGEQVSKVTTAVGDAVEMANSSPESNPEEAYPKASDDATIVYELVSNMERTQFFIDGEEMGTARRLKVRINNKEHTVVAKPEGCISKEQFIYPPYTTQAPLRFTFLIGECPM